MSVFEEPRKQFGTVCGNREWERGRVERLQTRWKK